MSNVQTRILIVDDNPNNIDLLFDYLDDVGFDISVAEDGLTALELCQYETPELILLDVMMPGIDGFETCRRLKTNPSTKDIPVIFMTALSDISDKVRGFNIGAVDYVTKPIHYQEILARVTTHLTIRRLQKELEATNNQLEKRVAERTTELAQANLDLAQANLDLAQANLDLAQANQHLQAEISERKLAYEQLRQTTDAYSRFVPTKFLSLLNQDNIIDVKLGEQVQMEMTILFIDIRDFTSFSEQMTPKDNFNFINGYFGRISPIIREYGGFVDKYIGDAIMALFPGKVENALKATISISERLTIYNQKRQRTGKAAVRVGMGVHRGCVVLGTVGEAERMEGTVISDAVNVASRVQELTKQYSGTIMVTEHALKGVKLAGELSPYHVRRLGHVQVKGKKEMISVFELLNGNDAEMMAIKLKSKTDFESGLRLYQKRQFAEASVYFSHVLKENPLDKASQLYLERCANFMINQFASDWDASI